MLNIYRASAGSGKTYQLTQEYIHLLFDPHRERTHRRILAVTFTNKATDEMKTRILKELHQLAQGESSDYREGLMTQFKLSKEAVNEKARKILVSILHDYSSFSISTIDRFFQQVIRSFARDIGVHGGYNLELDNSQTLEQSVDNLFLDLSKEENKQLLQWLTAYAEERVEQAESWNMRGNIMGLGQEIFKESYQHKAEDTNRKLHEKEFLANYRKKLRDIKDRFEAEVKQTAREGLAVMARYGLSHEDFSYKTTQTLDKLEKGGKLEVSDRFRKMADAAENCYAKKTPQDVKSTIETAYSNGLQQSLQQIVSLLTIDIVPYNSAIIVLKHINTLGILSDLAVQIKKLTDEQNTMLISDSNMLLNKIIDNSDTPFVYEKTGIHIDNFMIDEFQDTSTLQWKNFYPLISNSLAAGKFNLVVGDVKQSIYRWRNSDWKLLDEKLQESFRPEELNEENLGTNWRSDRNIVEFNNSFFRRGAQLLQSKLNANLEPVLPAYPSLTNLQHKIEHAYANTSQKTKPNAKDGYVEFCFIAADENEDGWKAESLERLPRLLEEIQERGYQPSDICMLVRTNGEEQSVIHRLLSFKTSPDAKAGYCYDVMGNEGLLVGTAASVRFILGIMQLFVNPADTIQQTIVNYEYARGRMGKTENEALNLCFNHAYNINCISPLFTDNENSLLKQLRHRSLFDMVEQIIALFGIGSWHREAVFVQAFQDVVFRYTTGKTADLNSFLNWWKKHGEHQCISTPDNPNAMRIMTVHKSKGLDFKVVVMPFCDWKIDSTMRNILWCEPQAEPFNELPLLPIEYSSKLGQSVFAENYFDEQMHLYIDSLNVAYVAFTRARHEMICMLPAPKKEVESLDKISTLSDLLTACFTVETPGLDQEIIPLSPAYNAEQQHFELGTPTQAPSEKQKASTENDIRIHQYPSVSSTDRLRMRHQSLDYLDENQSLTDSRLNYGLIMHDILKEINRPEDQSQAIESMLREGRINQNDRAIIEQELEKFWKLPETSGWFTSDAKILNETTILTPSGEQFRPDRVIIRGTSATIIDYKFGDIEKKSYTRQVKQYMSLIDKMGYQSSGFVCYVSLGKIEKVE